MDDLSKVDVHVCVFDILIVLHVDIAFFIYLLVYWQMNVFTHLATTSIRFCICSVNCLMFLSIYIYWFINLGLQWYNSSCSFLLRFLSLLINPFNPLMSATEIMRRCEGRRCPKGCPVSWHTMTYDLLTAISAKLLKKWLCSVYSHISWFFHTPLLYTRLKTFGTLSLIQKCMEG